MKTEEKIKLLELEVKRLELEIELLKEKNKQVIPAPHYIPYYNPIDPDPTYTPSYPYDDVLFKY